MCCVVDCDASTNSSTFSLCPTKYQQQVFNQKDPSSKMRRTPWRAPVITEPLHSQWAPFPRKLALFSRGWPGNSSREHLSACWLSPTPSAGTRSMGQGVQEEGLSTCCLLLQPSTPQSLFAPERQWWCWHRDLPPFVPSLSSESSRPTGN